MRNVRALMVLLMGMLLVLLRMLRMLLVRVGRRWGPCAQRRGREWSAFVRELFGPGAGVGPLKEPAFIA